MAGPILYDGTGLPDGPHRRRYAPRPAEGGAVSAGVGLAEMNNAAVEPDDNDTALVAALAADTPPVDSQEPAGEANDSEAGEPAEEEATSPQGAQDAHEDPGAATLASLGL